MGFNLADFLSEDDLNNLKAKGYELPTQSEQAVDQMKQPMADELSQILGKPVAEGIVRDQAIPPKTAVDSAKVFEENGLVPPAEVPPAAQSAKVFEEAGLVPDAKQAAADTVESQSLPGKTAVDSAKVFEENGAIPEDLESVYSKLFGGFQDKVPELSGKSATDSAKVFEQAGGSGAVPSDFTELGKPLAEDLVKSQSIPGKTAADSAAAFAENGFGEVADKGLIETLLGGAGKLAGRAALPLTIAQTALASPPMGDPSEARAMPVPGHPELTAKGPDIIPMPDTGTLPGPVGLEQARAEADAMPLSPATGAMLAGGPSTPGSLPPDGTPGSAGGPSLFSMVSDKYKAMAPGLTPTDDTASRALAAKGAVPGIPGVGKSSDSGDTSSGKMPSILERYLQGQKDMLDAQKAQGSNQLIAGLARAGGTLAHSVTGAKAAMDQTGFNALEANASTPVTNIEKAQAANLKNLQTQQSLMQTQQMADQVDPDSVASKAFRKSVEKLAPGIAAQYGDMWSHVSAADGALLLKPIELREQINARLQQAALAKQSHLNEANFKHLETAQKTYNDEIKKSHEAAATADRALANIEGARYSPIAAQAIPIEMARAIVGGGRINQQEIQKMGGVPTVTGRLYQIAKSMSEGTLTDENYRWFKDLAERMKSSAQADIHEITMKHAKQFSVNSGHPVPQAYYELTGDQLPQNVAGSAGSAPSATPGPSSATSPSAPKAPGAPATNEVERLTKDGRVAIFDAGTKKFLRYK